MTACAGGDPPAEPLRVVLIAGPTAGGKSALALRIAEAVPGRAAIINADSQQVYRELRILTARPTSREEAQAPHRLYGVRAAAEPFSAGQWLEAATAEIAAAQDAGRLPIVVGGTGLYLGALTAGLAPTPDIPAAVREAVRGRAAEGGAAALHGELCRRDPAMAERLRPSDTQRLARALEVLDATGESLAVWQGRRGAPSRVQPLLRLVVAPERSVLRARIDERFTAMVDAGALEEVRAVARLGLDATLPAMKAVGVRELSAVLAGRLTLDEAAAAAQAATRQYAKRQLTWLRRRMADWTWLDAQQSESFAEGSLSIIRRFLLT